MQHAPAIRRIPSSQMANPFLYNIKNIFFLKKNTYIYKFLYSPSSSFDSSFHLTFFYCLKKIHLKRTG